MTWDAVVIGAGANGLAAAGCLARAGRRVLVLERRAGEAGDPAWEAGWVPPTVASHLGLAAHGWTPLRPDPWLTIPLDGGGVLELGRDVTATAAAISRVSPADGARWPEFCARMARLAGFLERLYAAPPPDPTGSRARDAVHLLGLARRFRGLGRTGMTDLLRTLPMSVAELLDDWFVSDALKGALGGIGVTGIRQGPRSGGTAFVLLHHHAGSPPGVFMAATSGLRTALTAAARRLGAEIRLGTEVARVTVPAERVTGVVLANGEEIPVRLVLSSADPRRTFLDLVDPACFTPEFRHAVANIKFRGARAVVELTAAAPPAFAAFTIAPGLDYLERAYDAAKHGRVSAEPFVDVRAPEPAANDGHGLLASVQYAPYALREGSWDDARRRALGETTAALLRARAPALGALRVERVRTPRELEVEYGLTEGHTYHGELTLDQILFMRPVPGWARYRTPVAGLYLAGAGAHPGGGIPGGAGFLAARAALADGS